MCNVRIFNDEQKRIDLIEAAISKRKALRKTTNALRLVNGLGDALPRLVLEQYDDHCVIHMFDKRWVAHKEALAEFVKSRLGVRYLIIKERLNPQALKSEQINASVWIHQSLEAIVVAGGREKVKSIMPLGQDTDFRGSGRMPESYLAALLVKTK